MLKPEKILDEKEGTGDSLIFNAQWYPMVTCQLWYEEGSTCTCKLQGSVDNVHWEDVDDGGDNPSILKSTHWYLYYKVVISANDRKASAIIGAGGA